MSGKKIIIKVWMKNHVYELTTYEGEYRNLMVLLSDKLCMEDFGECKGIGRCGTCHIYVLDPGGISMVREGNENSTLTKNGKVKVNSRLACQIPIDEFLNGFHIQVEF